VPPKTDIVFQNVTFKQFQILEHQSHTRRWSDCLMRARATLTSCVCAMNITQQLRLLRIPHAVIFSRANRETIPAHSNESGLLS